MPKLNQRLIVDPSITNESFKVDYGNACFDTYYRYAAFSDEVSYETSITIFDLQTGREIKKIEMGKEDGNAVSISPDLERILFKPEFKNVLKLLDITGDVREIAEIEFSHSRNERPGAFHAFASSDRFVTKESMDTFLKVYDAKTGSLIHQSRKQIAAKQPNILADGRSLYTHADSSRVMYRVGNESTYQRPGRILWFTDLSTGRYSGELKLDVPNDFCRGPRVSPDATKIVCFEPQGKASRTVRGFSADGTCQFQIPFPNDAARANDWRVRWLGNDYFVIGNVLASFEQQKIICRIKDFDPEQIVESTGQALFIKRHNRQPYMIAKNVVMELENELKASEANVTKLLKPGDPVSVVYELPKDVPVRDIEKKFEYAMYKAITGAGFKLKKDAKVKLTLIVGEKITGNTTRYAFRMGGTVGIPQVHLVCRMSLAGPSGVPFHTKEVTFRQPSSGINGRDVKEILSAARRWQWKQLLNFSSDEFSTEYVNFDLPVLEIETMAAEFKQ